MDNAITIRALQLDGHGGETANKVHFCEDPNRAVFEFLSTNKINPPDILLPDWFPQRTL